MSRHGSGTAKLCRKLRIRLVMELVTYLDHRRLKHEFLFDLSDFKSLMKSAAQSKESADGRKWSADWWRHQTPMVRMWPSRETAVSWARRGLFLQKISQFWAWKNPTESLSWASSHYVLALPRPLVWVPLWFQLTSNSKSLFFNAWLSFAEMIKNIQKNCKLQKLCNKVTFKIEGTFTVWNRIRLQLTISEAELCRWILLFKSMKKIYNKAPCYFFRFFLSQMSNFFSQMLWSRKTTGKCTSLYVQIRIISANHTSLQKGMPSHIIV